MTSSITGFAAKLMVFNAGWSAMTSPLDADGVDADGLRLVFDCLPAARDDCAEQAGDDIDLVVVDCMLTSGIQAYGHLPSESSQLAGRVPHPLCRDVWVGVGTSQKHRGALQRSVRGSGETVRPDQPAAESGHAAVPAGGPGPEPQREATPPWEAQEQGRIGPPARLLPHPPHPAHPP